MITADQLAQATGCSPMRAENWLPSIAAAMSEFGIDTPARAAAFLAQIGHESGHLQYTRELWGPTPAQAGYEGRVDLGNTTPGDGYLYRGRGLIQITGRANYRACTIGLRQSLPDVPDFEDQPGLLEGPKWAARSAAWYWRQHGCNEMADAGQFTALTRRINGGTNGLDDRVALWEAAQAAVGIA
jgi:putative chitinase